MLRKLCIPILAPLALVMLLVNGCGERATSPAGAGTVESQNLNDPTGGYNTQGDQPGFGDPALVSSASAEVDAADRLEITDPEVASWTSLPSSVRAYSVTLLWGVLRKDPAIRVQTGDPAVGFVTDWSGYAAVNSGALVLRTTIAFDAQDHIVRPRTDKKRIDWVSHTTDSYDGIRFWVYQPFPSKSPSSGDSLTVVAGAHTWKFLVNELAHMDTTYVVDDLGNRFAIKAFRVEPGSCTRGFLNGIWLLSTSAGGNGFLRGRVLGNRGEVLGYIRGFFGQNRQGSRVFFAKYIDRHGSFKGLLRGTWTDIGRETAETGEAAAGENGLFRGQMLDANKDPIGAVYGHWHARDDATDGFFEGLWSSGCTN